MRYLRAYQFLFDKPNWLTNLLLGLVCMLIPVVGGIVFLGYAYEMIEELSLKQDDRRYPDFDFNRFLKYLVRGVWPFVLHLIIGIPVILLLGIFWMVVMVVAARNPHNPGIAVAVMFLLPVAGITLGFFLSLAAVPLSLHAGLSQELALGPAYEFLKDFWKRVIKELLLAQLFMMASSVLLTLLGLLVFCVGAYFAGALIQFATYHIQYQLYLLYLERGGTAIPFKVEAVET
jgi:hypothetical protein